MSAPPVSDPGVTDELLLRLRVERFLYEEAALLDAWDLDAWAELFTDDARYVVPATDARQGDVRTTLVLLEDDLSRIRGRVARLNSRRAHREFPSSNTRRLITNVRVLNTDDGLVRAVANFVVHRFRNAQHHVFVGTYLYELVPHGDSFRIQLRRAELDLEALRPQSTVSIIV